MTERDAILEFWFGQAEKSEKSEHPRFVGNLLRPTVRFARANPRIRGTHDFYNHTGRSLDGQSQGPGPGLDEGRGRRSG